MEWSRQYILGETVRTGYTLRSFAPVIYFASCYTMLTLVSGLMQVLVCSVLIGSGITLVGVYLFRSRSNVVTNTERYTRVILVLAILSAIPLAVLYLIREPVLPIGASLISTLGLVASAEHKTTLKKAMVMVYPEGVNVYESRYPMYLHFLYALTHDRREYGDFEADQNMNEILLTVSTEHEIGFISFDSEEEYIDWINESRNVMACEICYKNHECEGSNTEVKGIYASDFDPSRMSICTECQDSLTRQLINDDKIESSRVTASRI